jgi:hypothetical protein
VSARQRCSLQVAADDSDAHRPAARHQEPDDYRRSWASPWPEALRPPTEPPRTDCLEGRRGAAHIRLPPGRWAARPGRHRSTWRHRRRLRSDDVCGHRETRDDASPRSRPRRREGGWRLRMLELRTQLRRWVRHRRTVDDRGCCVPTLRSAGSDRGSCPRTSGWKSLLRSPPPSNGRRAAVAASRVEPVVRQGALWKLMDGTVNAGPRSGGDTQVDTGSGPAAGPTLATTSWRRRCLREKSARIVAIATTRATAVSDARMSSRRWPAGSIRAQTLPDPDPWTRFHFGGRTERCVSGTGAG